MIDKEMIVLFFTGFCEMVIVAVWTSSVAKSKIVFSGIITLINIFIWYFVLQTIIENLNNVGLIGLYALGCATGTMVGTWLESTRGKSLIKRLSTIRTYVP